MRQFTALVCSILFACNVYGQNMVLNPSFEQFNICPAYFGLFPNMLPHWTDVTIGTADYFNACNTNNIADVPENFFGWQNAYHGVAYAGLFTYADQDGREYLDGELIPLLPGVTYKVELHVSKGSNFLSAAGSDGLGVFFYQNGIGANTNILTNLPVNPQIDYSAYGVIMDTGGWVTLIDTFHADSAYTHLVIGNFHNNANTNIQNIYLQSPNNAYYYIDSVIVEPFVYVPLSVTITGGGILCNGNSTGTATATPSNGLPPYTYLWSNGQTTQTATNLSAGTYTCTVTDVGNTSVVQSVTITQPTAVNAVITYVYNTTCGSNNGIAVAGATGGTGPYTYSWWPYGGNNGSAVMLGAGLFICTVTDANGCTDTAQVTIGQTSNITLSSSISNVNCYSQSNGSATVSVSGGTGPYTYLWSNGQTTQTATNLAAGSYSVTVTDANNCTATTTISIGQPSQLTATISSSAPVSCYGQSTGSATVTAGGGSPGYTYLWSNGQTTQTATGLGAGAYTCTVTDAHGCIATASATITQPPLLTAAITSSNSTSCAQSNGTATVTAGGGTPGYSYSWSPYGGNAATATGLGAGVYTVTVTDSKGCTATAQVTIATSTPLTVTAITTPVSCHGGSNGTATATVSGGNGPYTYNWSNGQATAMATSLAAGSYNVTVTDVNSCAGTATVTITQPTLLNAAIGNTTNVHCNGQNTGTATVNATGGTPGYSYLWGNGQTTQTAANLTAGSYTVTVTDTKGCTATATATITQSPALTAMITNSANATCSQNNGTATVAAGGGTGPYAYNWSNGGTTATISNLGAGNYSVTVTDAYNCTATASITISQSSALSLNVTATDVSCYGLSDGTASVSIGAGTPPYTYSWSNSQATPAIGNLSAGSYIITVTDAIGCQGTDTVTVTGPAAPLDAQLANAADVQCFGAMDGQITITPIGGTAPYTYLWNNGSTQTQLSNLDTGTHSVIVTDAHGCTDSASVQLSQPGELVINVQVLTHSCANEKDGSATVTVTGGTSPYSYSWNSTPQQAAPTVNDLAPGSYMVTVTDANNCVKTQAVSINAYPLPAVSAGEDKVYCHGREGVQLNATGAVTYTWTPTTGLDNASIQDPTATPGTTTTYTVTGTDSMGCTNTDAVTITVLTEQPMSTGEDLHICEGEVTRLNASGGASYQWSPVEGLSDATIANPVVTAIQTATYTVVITQNECFADTLTQSVNIYPKPTIELGPDIKAFSGTSITLHAEMAGATSIRWSPSDNLSCEDCTAPEVKVVNTITYTATASNEACSASDDITITATCDGSEIFMANTFTPNKDGNNDVLYPQSASNVRINTFRVYDRWGEKVFERSNFASNDPQQGWDGSWKGQPLMTGIYVYYLEVICASGEKILLKGDVAIVK